MKKTLLFLAAVAFSFGSAIAQDHIIDRERESTALPASGDPLTNDPTFMIADHFKLEGTTEVDRFVFYGFTDDNALATNTTGVNLLIFDSEDSELDPNLLAPSGIPSAANDNGAIYSFINIDPSDVTFVNTDSADREDGSTAYFYDIVISAADIMDDNEDMILPTGDYWVAVTLDIQNDDEYFFWNSNVSAPADYGPAGYSPNEEVWAPVHAFFTGLAPVNAMAWSLWGEQTLSVGDFEENNFKHLVQNNQLLLTSDVEIDNITIYNTLGQQVASETINSTSSSIDLSTLTSGVYFSKVNVNGQEKAFKFVK